MGCLVCDVSPDAFCPSHVMPPQHVLAPPASGLFQACALFLFENPRPPSGGAGSDLYSTHAHDHLSLPQALLPAAIFQTKASHCGHFPNFLLVRETLIRT